MDHDYPNQNLNRSRPVPKYISDKYSSSRYGLCPMCKHEDEVCDGCDSVQMPVVRDYGLFSETMTFYHAKFEPRKDGEIK